MVELCFTALSEIDNIQLFKSRSQTQGIPKHFHARFCKKSLNIEVIGFFFLADAVVVRGGRVAEQESGAAARTAAAPRGVGCFDGVNSSFVTRRDAVTK